MSSVPDTSAPTTLPASASRLLAGKVAFVTGGARGIGAAIVQRLARDGAAVAFTYSSSEAPAQALVASIEAGGGKALALRADSADAAALTQAIDTAARKQGRHGGPHQGAGARPGAAWHPGDQRAAWPGQPRHEPRRWPPGQQHARHDGARPPCPPRRDRGHGGLSGGAG